MGDQLLAQVRDVLEGPIDFEGQKKTEALSTWLLIASGIVAFLIGYIQENVYYTLWIGLLGTTFVFFVVIPPWPAYNEDPVPWLKSTSDAANQVGIMVDGKKVN